MVFYGQWSVTTSQVIILNGNHWFKFDNCNADLQQDPEGHNREKVRFERNLKSIPLID